MDLRAPLATVTLLACQGLPVDPAAVVAFTPPTTYAAEWGEVWERCGRHILRAPRNTLSTTRWMLVTGTSDRFRLSGRWVYAGYILQSNTIYLSPWAAWAPDARWVREHEMLHAMGQFAHTEVFHDCLPLQPRGVP